MGHPVWERPEEDELEEFILHGGETSHKELFRKVTCACEKVNVKEIKLKRKDTSFKESYISWVKERVCLIKLPFVIDPTYVLDIPDPILVSIEEVGRLRATIAGLEQDKESLEHNLYDTTYEKNQISYDLEKRDKQVLENMEELWAEKRKRKKILGGLFSAGVDFKNLNSKLKEAQAEVIVQEQGDRAEALRVEYSNLADFANNMIRDTPWMYKRANGVANFDNTPQEVLEFIRLCDIMLKEFKAHLKVAIKAPL
ncbi:hypothetical protein KIW84_013207 [Lathyrus oleraceus]|uniref:DUF7745 domain-containing protein n=1 Tax=Pisum sativum TaxID=3888 RepID=A0A9D5BJR7_PEA|nr:hypothetical protein KIW84_013207 [Pisum sativum]